MTQYEPKGGLCMKCIHSKRACNYLDFSAMTPIDSYQVAGVNFVRVRCTDYKRKT